MTFKLATERDEIARCCDVYAAPRCSWALSMLSAACIMSSLALRSARISMTRPRRLIVVVAGDGAGCVHAEESRERLAQGTYSSFH